MKYQLNEKSSNNINKFLETVLTNRNIADIESFKKSNIEDLEKNTYKNLDNVEAGVDLLIKHMTKHSKTILVVDPDVDGITSSAVLYNYLKNIYDVSNITPISHSGKEHGLSKDIIIPEDTEFIIVPDAGSNDYEKINMYKAKGIDILVIDHHIVEGGYSENAVVINNQLSQNYTNKNFSGVGVVYRFLQAMDDTLFCNNADNYLDLVAIGLISDVMDTNSYETRYFIQQGLLRKNLKNPFLKALLKYTKSESQDLERYTIPIDVSFGIAPSLNATMRFGTAEEKLAVFKCFTATEDELKANRIGKKVFDMCIENKTKQNENKRESSNKIIKTLTKKQIEEDKILIIDATGIIDRTLTGITSMELASIYQRPVLVGTVNNGILAGSARGYNGFPCEDLKGQLAELGLFNFLEGHSAAFGFSIPLNKKDEVIDQWNKIYKDIKIEGYYEVDFALRYDELSNSDYYLINNYRYLWGTNVDEPLFALTNIPLYPNSLRVMGEKKNTVKYEFQGRGYIKFNLPEGHELLKLAEDYDSMKNLELDVVGKLSMSSFKGRTSPLVMIDDYEIREVAPGESKKDGAYFDAFNNIWGSI